MPIQPKNDTPAGASLQPHRERPGRWSRLRKPLLLSFATISLAVACEYKNPLAQAEPIGEFPEWGTGFGKEAESAPDPSALEQVKGEGPAPDGKPAHEGQKGGSAVPAKNPMAGEDWSGGDPAHGKTVFLNNCAMCHGAAGEGGMRMGLQVPTLRDPGWHERVDDNYIASTISHGKGKMPAFMSKLDKPQLAGVIAYVRTLKKKPAAAQPKAAPPAKDSDKAAAGEGTKSDEGEFGEGW